MGILSNKTEKIAKTDDMAEMVTLYKAMTDALRENNKLMEKEQKVDKLRFNKLTLKVDILWPKLNRDQQLVICEELVRDGYMDQRAVDVLVIFMGSINQGEPPQPCVRINSNDKPMGSSK